VTDNNDGRWKLEIQKYCLLILLFFLLMFSNYCFILLYILSYFLCDPGFPSFDPLKKIAPERSVGKFGKLVSLLIAEKQKVLKI
jgi:uncharacterized membrane protein